MSGSTPELADIHYNKNHLPTARTGLGPQHLNMADDQSAMNDDLGGESRSTLAVSASLLAIGGKVVVPPASPYSPVDPASDTIRLLRLEQSVNLKGIRGTLIHCSLSRAPRYTALSYAWGSPELPKEIQLNGMTVLIRRNLWEALNAMQSINFQPPRADAEEVVGTLWIDSICIDQNNTAEKNHQVQQMAAIYSTASTVISWLGPHTPDSTMLFEWGGRDLSSGWKGMDIVTSLQTLGEATKRLLEREYWCRLWIIQEVLLAQHHYQLLCGTDCISGYSFFTQWIGPDDSISEFCDRFSTRLNEDETVDVWAAPGYRVLWYKYGDVEDALSLYELFSTFCNRECVNPHDKIYGLLGIVGANEAPRMIKVDYGKSRESLCCDVLTAVADDLRREMPDDPNCTGSFLIDLLPALQLPGPTLEEWHDAQNNYRMPRSIPEWVRTHLKHLGIWMGDS